jgi:hypothetical protein
MVGYFLVGGAINAVVLSVIAFLLSRFVGDIYGRSLLVIFLFIAVGVCVGFVCWGRREYALVLCRGGTYTLLFWVLWACSVCAAPHIGLLRDGRCILSGTLCLTT